MDTTAIQGLGNVGICVNVLEAGKKASFNFPMGECKQNIDNTNSSLVPMHAVILTCMAVPSAQASTNVKVGSITSWIPAMNDCKASKYIENL